MAKTASGTFVPSSPKKRKGIVSKKKSSNYKQSKNYKKKYRGQGR